MCDSECIYSLNTIRLINEVPDLKVSKNGAPVEGRCKQIGVSISPEKPLAAAHYTLCCN